MLTCRHNYNSINCRELLVVCTLINVKARSIKDKTHLDPENVLKIVYLIAIVFSFISNEIVNLKIPFILKIPYNLNDNVF